MQLPLFVNGPCVKAPDHSRRLARLLMQFEVDTRFCRVRRRGVDFNLQIAPFILYSGEKPDRYSTQWIMVNGQPCRFIRVTKPRKITGAWYWRGVIKNQVTLATPVVVEGVREKESVFFVARAGAIPRGKVGIISIPVFLYSPTTPRKPLFNWWQQEDQWKIFQLAEIRPVMAKIFDKRIQKEKPVA